MWRKHNDNPSTANGSNSWWPDRGDGLVWGERAHTDWCGVREHTPCSHSQPRSPHRPMWLNFAAGRRRTKPKLPVDAVYVTISPAVSCIPAEWMKEAVNFQFVILCVVHVCCRFLFVAVTSGINESLVLSALQDACRKQIHADFKELLWRNDAIKQLIQS